jgi:murein DD-endopeptidase MepM/ murein hydrolase activator NlpD/SH3-like domain-containing protein
MRRTLTTHLSYIAILIAMLIFGCKSGTVNLFKPSSPHEQYMRKLSTAGLDRTAIGYSWINNASSIMQKALSITLPFKETGYFAAEKIPVTAYRFAVTKGQKINISLDKKPIEQFMIYVDVWEERQGSSPKLLASADTLGNVLQLDAEVTGTFLIRLQPELLRSGQYTLDITIGPSLGFPVKNAGTIQSFFGDGRDSNSRKHEGIDIFAPRLTPVVAIAPGIVTRVNQNNLGGNVVWMRPSNKDFTLYYAHLDQQIAVEGQKVKPGDTLGLVGNTGNARTTAPHLHFGIYGSSGAVDPLPYVNPVRKSPALITAPLNLLNATVRSLNATGLRSTATDQSGEFTKFPAGTILQVNAATGKWYQVELPDGQSGFIASRNVSSTAKPLRAIKIKSDSEPVYDQPDSLAAVKMNLNIGSSVGVLGKFAGYQLVIAEDRQTGWIKDTNL